MIPCAKPITHAGKRCTETNLCNYCAEIFKNYNPKIPITKEQNHKEIIYQLLKYINPKCSICYVPATRQCRFDGYPHLSTYYCDAHRRTEDEFNNGHKLFIARYVDLPAANIIREAIKIINITNNTNNTEVQDW